MTTVLEDVVVLRSRVPGRERWKLPAIRNHPEIAAAVEAAIRRQPYILDVRANSITGTVLLRWDPRGPVPAVTEILQRALEEPPATIESLRAIVLERKKDGKTLRLIQKLVLGGAK